MNRQDILKLAEILQLKQVAPSQSWVKASCPFASKKHEKGSDSRPSFGVKIGKQSHYFCFSCSMSGNLFSLPTTLAFVMGKDNPEAREFIFTHENNELPDYEEIPLKKVLKPILKTTLKRFKPMQPDYRDISADSIQLWDLRYDAVENRIILLIQDRHGRTVGVRGRVLSENHHLKYRTYSELTRGDDPKASGIWYGMQHPLVENKLLVICESEIEAILLKQSGISNAWASMGASIPSNQIRALKSLTCPILLFFDDDEAGHTARDKVYMSLKGLMPLYHIQNYYGVKDIGKAHEKRILPKLLASMCLYRPRKHLLDK